MVVALIVARVGVRQSVVPAAVHARVLGARIPAENFVSGLTTNGSKLELRSQRSVGPVA